jgi:hypothetical protein
MNIPPNLNRNIRRDDLLLEEQIVQLKQQLGEQKVIVKNILKQLLSTEC